jgi:hypothetical protein
VCDLAERVNTGVRAAGTKQADRFTRDAGERFFDTRLHSSQARLPLPAVKAGAVVRQHKSQVAQRRGAVCRDAAHLPNRLSGVKCAIKRLSAAPDAVHLRTAHPRQRSRAGAMAVTILNEFFQLRSKSDGTPRAVSLVATAGVLIHLKAVRNKTRVNSGLQSDPDAGLWALLQVADLRACRLSTAFRNYGHVLQT